MKCSNKLSKLAVLTAALTLVLICAAPGFAKKDNKGEREAARIWAKIKTNLDRGQELEACRAAKKMAPYAETEAYAFAKKALLKKGISIESPLLSWTSKAIVRVQNIVERDLIATGDLKHIGALPKHRDAWGTPLRVEMVKMGDYLYIVRAAGPDKKFMTGDDVLMGGLKPRGMGKEPQKKGDNGKSSGSASGKSSPSAPPAKDESNPTLKGLLKQPGSPSTASGGNDTMESGTDQETESKDLRQEETVELGDLLKNTD